MNYNNEMNHNIIITHIFFIAQINSHILRIKVLYNKIKYWMDMHSFWSDVQQMFCWGNIYVSSINQSTLQLLKNLPTGRQELGLHLYTYTTETGQGKHTQPKNNNTLQSKTHWQAPYHWQTGRCSSARMHTWARVTQHTYWTYSKQCVHTIPHMCAKKVYFQLTLVQCSTSTFISKCAQN